MNYKKNFNPKLLKKGSKLRRQLDENTYEYLTVGDYYPQYGWELRLNDKNLYKTLNFLGYIKLSDLPGELELLTED